MAASSTNTNSNLNNGDETKDETNVQGKILYPLYCDRIPHSFIKVSSRDNARIERRLFSPKLHIIVVCNDHSSLSMV